MCYQKRGTCVVKDNTTVTAAATDEAGNVTTKAIQRPHWLIDECIPIFKGEDREYIDKLIRTCDGECKKPEVAYIN